MPLAAVHALQIIDEWHCAGEEPYISYELNLVLSDGRRIHLLTTTECASAQRIGLELSGQLSIDVWQAPAIDKPSS